VVYTLPHGFIGSTGHGGTLARILLELLRTETEFYKVHFYLINCLAVVKSELDAAIASANAAEVVFLYNGTDDMFASTNLLQFFCSTIFWKTTDDQISICDLTLLSIIVVLHRTLTRSQMVRS